MLLAVEEDLSEGQVDQINKVLQSHKDFKSYKMVNWLTYYQIHGTTIENHPASYDDEDEDGGMGGEGMIEVAENYMRAPRNAIIKNRKHGNNSIVK